MAPHGNTLVNLLVDEKRRELLNQISLNLQDISLNDRQCCDLELLANGALSPLKWFMNSSGYEIRS